MPHRALHNHFSNHHHHSIESAVCFADSLINTTAKLLEHPNPKIANDPFHDRTGNHLLYHITRLFNPSLYFGSPEPSHHLTKKIKNSIKTYILSEATKIQISKQQTNLASLLNPQQPHESPWNKSLNFTNNLLKMPSTLPWYPVPPHHQKETQTRTSLTVNHSQRHHHLRTHRHLFPNHLQHRTMLC